MAATAVVSLMVDETGAVAGLTRFEQRAQQSMTSASRGVQGVATRLTQARAETDALGAAGTKAGTQVASGFDKANAHALTHLDTVRLLRDDLGVRIPRSMEKLISQWGAFQQLATAGFGLLAGVGVFQLLYSVAKSIGSEIASWGSFLLGDGKAVKDLYSYMVAANDQLLISPRNRDQSIANLHTIDEEISKLEAKKALRFVGGNEEAALHAVGGLANVDIDGGTFTRDDDARLTKFIEMRDQASKASKDLQLQGDAEVRRSQEETAASALEGFRRIAQERKNAYAEIDFKVNNDKTLSPSDGAHMKLLADQKAQAEEVKLNQETSDMIRNLWDQANAARFQGEQRAFVENEQAKQKFVEEETRKGVSQPRIFEGTAAMDQKYLAEKTERQRVFAEQTRKMQEAADMASLEGTARVMAQEKAEIADLTEARRVAGQQASEFDEQWAARAETIHKRTYEELTKTLQDYARSEREAADQSAAGSTHGFLQIQLETQRKLNEAFREYQKLTDGMDDPSLRAQAHATYSLQVGDITAEGNAKSTDLARKNADETNDINDRALSVRSGAHNEGLMGIIAQEQQQTAKIQAEYRKQVDAWQEACNDEILIGQQAADRKAAIDNLYNAQIVEQQRRTQDQLAGLIESAFDNPMAALKKAMKQQMAEILADWMMQVTRSKIFGGTSTPGAAPQGQHTGGILGGLLDRAMGRPAATYGSGSTGAPRGAPAYSPGSSSIPGIFGGQNTVAPGRTASYLPSGVSVMSTGDYASGGQSTSSSGATFPSSSGRTSTSTYGGSISTVGSDAVAIARDLGVGARPASAQQTPLSAVAGGLTLQPPVSTEDGSGAASVTASDEAAPATGVGAHSASVQSDGSGVVAQQPLSSTNIAGTVGKAISDTSTLAKMYGLTPSGAASQVPGNGTNPSLGSSVLSSGLTYASAGMAAYNGAEGVYKSFSQGGVNGALDGTMSGAEAGAAIGSIIPGLGTVVGGVIGGIAGLATNLIGEALGEDGKYAARDYYKKTLFPELEGVKNSFSGTGGNYMSAVSDANRDSAEGMVYMTSKWGADAAGWVNSNYLQKELTDVTNQIERLARGGAQFTGRTAAEFHDGGVIGGFGSLATSSTEGFIHALRGETVMDRSSSATHAPVLSAMRSGASPADIASMYMGSMRGSTSSAPSPQGGDTHNWSVSAIDGPSFRKMLDDGGNVHVSRSLNKLAGNYAGDGQV